MARRCRRTQECPAARSITTTRHSRAQRPRRPRPAARGFGAGPETLAEEARPAAGVVVLPLEPQAASTPAPPTASAATPAPPSTVRRDRLAAPIAPPRPREASARSV